MRVVCGCFWKTQLRAAGTEKINFSGGEPFLHARLLGQMVDYCKRDLSMSVSIVSNGSRIKENWLLEHHGSVDYLAISCDSLIDSTNAATGRRERLAGGQTVTQTQILQQVAQWCRQYDILLKVNTVVNANNWQEDMSVGIADLRPQRWKVFQCLAIAGENTGFGAHRDVEPFIVSDAKFTAFIDRHRRLNPVPESNDDMKDSYLILDEQMRFLNCQRGDKRPGRSILDVGVMCALAEAGFDNDAFQRRGGHYIYDKTIAAQDMQPSVQDIEDFGSPHANIGTSKVGQMQL